MRPTRTVKDFKSVPSTICKFSITKRQPRSKESSKLLLTSPYSISLHSLTTRSKRRLKCCSSSILKSNISQTRLFRLQRELWTSPSAMAQKSLTMLSHSRKTKFWLGSPILPTGSTHSLNKPRSWTWLFSPKLSSQRPIKTSKTPRNPLCLSLRFLWPATN